MSEMYDNPVAVLVGRDGYERVIGIPLPPPDRYDLPIPPRLCIVESTEPPQYDPIQRRTFKLSDFRSKTYQWWNVYNEGRTRTPEDGFVYLEDTLRALP